MIFDETALYSDQQAITADAVSTNIIDHGANRDIGPGMPLKIAILITETFDNLDSLDIELETDAIEAMSGITVPKTALLAIPLAALTAGSSYTITIPKGMERFTRLNYDVNGSNPSTGKITAGIVVVDQANDLS